MFIEVLIVGVMVGAIYSLVTIGYSMVYGILKLMNFAHGDVYIFGTLAVLHAAGQVPSESAPGGFSGRAIGGLLASLVEIIAYRRLRAAQHRMISMITALGAAYVIQNSSELTWGNQVLSFPSLFPNQIISVFGSQISVTHIFTLFVAVFVIVGFNLFLKHHKAGKAILCVSEDIPTSSLMGIPINRTISVVYFFGGVIRGAGRGALFGLLQCHFHQHGVSGHHYRLYRGGHRRHRQPGRCADRRHDSGAVGKPDQRLCIQFI